MKYKHILVSILVICFTANLLVLPVQADTLRQDDFLEDSFAKEVDFFDYARAWAVLRGLPEPPNHWHANVYMTYINQSGFKLLYAGLQDISLVQNVDFISPMQTILMHYKTAETKQDTLVSSSFLMIMSFNDTDASLHGGSPDKNDNLWASFSLGINLSELFPDVTFPAFNSGSEILPLEQNGNTWTWGMKYKNLTAFWVTADIVNEDNTNPNQPFGFATYDELTFKYTLTLEGGTATLHKDYTIGRMHDLFVFGGWFLTWPIYNHYNATGCYRYNAKVSDQTVYELLEETDVSMSIVEYQKVVLLDKETETTSVEGENVAENEVDVSDSSISTSSEEGELICNNDFSEKKRYKLYNLEETQFVSHDAKVRTCEIDGYARNRNLFQFQTSFQRYIPLVLIGMYPRMYQQAKETIANIDVADCLYVISYPSYGGYKIDHDPVLTAYFAPTQAVDLLASLKGPLLLATIGIPIIVGIALLRRRRTPSTINLP